MTKALTFVLCLLISINIICQPASSNDSPYDVVYNHLYYLQAESYNPVLAARSFPAGLDTLNAANKAIKLKQIFDGQGLFVALDEIPREPTYYDSLSNKASYLLFPDLLPEVNIVKVGNKWFYSAKTVEAIPALHNKVYPLGSDFLINLLPETGNREFLGLYIWQYLGILIILILAGIVYIVLNFIFKKILLSIKVITQSVIGDRIKVLRRAHNLLALWAVSLLVDKLLPVLQFSVTFNEVLSSILQIASSIIFLLLVFKLFDLFISYLEIAFKATESKMDDQLLPLLMRVGQFLILSFWFLHILTVLKVNITTLIAGISIGGLAIALAAQDTLKNLLGSINIFLDRPFQIGDWVKFSDGEGTVEEVGFRSTRIRSFANSLIYVPNSKLSDAKIDNYGLRIYRRYTTNIGIKYDTPPDKIEAFVDGLRALVLKHPNINHDNFEIHLNDLGASSLQILVYIFFDVPNWTSELKAKHNLLMEIIKLAHSLGVEFAFPSQSIYIEKGAP